MNDDLIITPTFHPDLRVRAAGFELTHPYVEQCWSALLGPSATTLLRRLPALWADHVPAHIDRETLSRSLGLGAGAGDASRLMRSIERCVHHRLARWEDPGRGLDVFLNVPALRDTQLERLPDWTREAHGRLLDAQVAEVAPQLARPAISVRLDLMGRRSSAPARQARSL